MDKNICYGEDREGEKNSLARFPSGRLCSGQLAPAGRNSPHSSQGASPMHLEAASPCGTVGCIYTGEASSVYNCRHFGWLSWHVYRAGHFVQIWRMKG